MSLLHKIRRRHNAFMLRRSTQIHGDGAASVFPIDDGEDEDGDGDEDEDEDEDEEADFILDSLQHADEQSGDISDPVPPIYETHQNLSVQTDVSAQSSIFIPADSAVEVGRGMQIIGKESRFWPRIAKTAAFLLVTAVAFSIGKLTAVGITLTVAFSCKLFARDQINSQESFISAETGQDHRSHESLPSNPEMVRPDNEVTFMEESNDPVGMLVSHLVVNANGHSQMTLEDHDEEALNLKDNRDTLLAQRRKLKRLNCIKLPPSASPFVEAMEDSPSSSSKASPRAWFRNAGNSTPTGEGAAASSAEMNKQGKFKSKVLLRHLRRKGEPQSAPSSPLSFSQEGNNRFRGASDGSDTERSAHPTAPVHRKSKFRPNSPIRTAAIRKQEMETSTCMPATLAAAGLHMPSFQAVEKMQSALVAATPTSRDATMKVGIHSPLASTHELQRRRRGKDRTPMTLVSQEGITAKTVGSLNQDSLLVAVQNGGEKRRKQVRVGTPWVAAGLVITISGLFVGRIVAVTGLVCYWYALSLKNRNASEKRK